MIVVEEEEAMLIALKSKLRSSFRHRTRSAGDFGEIDKMVDGMIVVEEEEQKSDDTQKPWCNGEFDKSSREDKAEHVDISKLEAEMEQEANDVSALEGDIAALTQEIADLDKSVAQATEQRKEEHTEYIEGIQLSQTAVGLVEKAKNRLQKFYNPTLYK